MSNDRRTPKKSERHKLLLIPVLAAVLLYVLLGSGDSTESPPGIATDASAKESAEPAGDSTPQPAAVPPWPEHPLGHILAHNPFFPHDAQATAAAQTPREPERLVPTADPAERAGGLTVSAIFRGPRGMTAVVDGQAVRVGDELPGGLFITRIDANGVEVAPRPTVVDSDGPN